MVTKYDYPPNWAVLPGASVTAQMATHNRSKRPRIEFLGNRQGLLSLGSLLVWISAWSDEESLSITGLDFVSARSKLSQTVVKPLDDDEREGRIVRMDKDQQFQWLASDELLMREGVETMRLGICPDGCCSGHMHGRIARDSEVDLYIDRTDVK